MEKAVFYHAGCPVCVDAEKMVLDYLDTSKVDVEVVDFNNDASKINEAESAGVKSVPALVLNGQTYHINYGASMEEVKNG
ncbi:thioredoxin family protein [Oceanobacillus jeddahense]|uniref:Thioredoxin family protein n=1 Tax=Oceanobacillus jeddahense TaxID=1462527 RepID=A0ABY5JWX9_9BACI|nr:thioredoxin family protein [Oceanobacillus jeddahense]UUI04634.1 thioredoxin family protein [Oceanobacillus jeddahense]